MSVLSYEIVDVFTDRPFAGNPLAVVFGADALAKDQMQALAREFHLSETVFVLPPTVDGATYRLRIFTPTAELPVRRSPERRRRGDPGTAGAHPGRARSTRSAGRACCRRRPTTGGPR